MTSVWSKEQPDVRRNLNFLMSDEQKELITLREQHNTYSSLLAIALGIHFDRAVLKRCEAVLGSGVHRLSRSNACAIFRIPWFAGYGELMAPSSSRRFVHLVKQVRRVINEIGATGCVVVIFVVVPRHVVEFNWTGKHGLAYRLPFAKPYRLRRSPFVKLPVHIVLPTPLLFVILSEQCRNETVAIGIVRCGNAGEFRDGRHHIAKIPSTIIHGLAVDGPRPPGNRRNTDAAFVRSRLIPRYGPLESKKSAL